MKAKAYIGTSGWSYSHWKNGFYRDVPRKDWLSYYAGCFPAVEINASFYRLQNQSTFERWYRETPAHFRFSLKANRYLTHTKRLKDPLPSIEVEREQAAALKEKLAVVLWQLPASFGFHLRRLEDFAKALKSWTRVRHVVEFRHADWFNEEVADLLKQHKIANCQSDAADWPLWDRVTTDLVYMRLHGHQTTYASRYSTKTLRKLSAKLAGHMTDSRSVYVFFDNDAQGYAPMNAQKLTVLLKQEYNHTSVMASI